MRKNCVRSKRPPNELPIFWVWESQFNGQIKEAEALSGAPSAGVEVDRRKGALQTVTVLSSQLWGEMGGTYCIKGSPKLSR